MRMGPKIFAVSPEQNQDVVPISSYDTAGSFLILGCNNGSIYYIGTHLPLLAASEQFRTSRLVPSTKSLLELPSFIWAFSMAANVR